MQFERSMSAVLFLVLFAGVAGADERGKLIFKDDFERNESQEKKDEIGNGWASNSASRAGGNKQVDLKDGAMHIAMHATADHAVSVRHDAAFRDGSVTMRFLLEHPQDTLGLDFADLELKTVHAGHLFKVTVGTKKLELMDSKTGVMNLEIREARTAKTLTPAQEEILAATKKVVPIQIETDKWYELDVRIAGETITVKIDGKETGSFTSAGFAHPTKKMLRLSVPKKAVVDDVAIYAAKAE